MKPDLPHLPYDPEQDRRALRWVLGVPLVILHVLMAGLCFAVYRTEPQGVWDDGAYAGIDAVCLVVLFLGSWAALLTLLPSRRRVLGLWWLAPPLALMFLTVVRAATV
ncbi:hypothetical protein ACIRNI_09730 [Streptomyces sp. NPDC093546]|uniref:hypothetical protein n=1 Tax=Streptomyces sp. NPDC093546 TaxID=3366040 RepID=UPI003818D125